MAQQRRASRRNGAVNGEVPAQVTEAEAVDAGEHAETNGDVNTHDNDHSEVTSKELTIVNGGSEVAQVETDPEKLKAYEAIVESFKEEFHEDMEQLPLFLHRQFTLMRNLDEQTSQHGADLMSDLDRYTDLRSKLAGVSLTLPPPIPGPSDSVVPSSIQPSNDVEPHPENSDPTSGDVATAQEHENTPPDAAVGRSDGAPSLVEAPKEQQPANSTSVPETAPQVPPEDEFDDAPVPWNATRTLIPRVPWLTDEILRTSEEKINLAETIYDVIIRHIHQLDYSVKEQETIIKKGHSYRLDEITAPRNLRPIPSTLLADDLGGDEALEVLHIEVPKTPAKRKRRGRPPTASIAQGTPGGMKTGLTIKLPPSAQGQPAQTDGAADEKYCVCQKPSSGIMVMCDNGDDCQNGSWFHLECLGMKEAPEDDALWYCPKCAPQVEAPHSEAPQRPAKRRRR